MIFVSFQSYEPADILPCSPNFGLWEKDAKLTELLSKRYSTPIAFIILVEDTKKRVKDFTAC